MSDYDFEEDLRHEGIEDSFTLKEARLERSGHLWVIDK